MRRPFHHVSDSIELTPILGNLDEIRDTSSPDGGSFAEESSDGNSQEVSGDSGDDSSPSIEEEKERENLEILAKKWVKLQPIEKLLYGLLNPVLRSEHSLAETYLGDAEIKFPLEAKAITLREIFSEKNIKNLSLNKEILDLYSQHIEEIFLKGKEELFHLPEVRKSRFFPHVAYNAASCVYMKQGSGMNQIFRNFQSFHINLATAGMEKIIVKKLRALQLKPNRINHSLILVTGSTPWELYFCERDLMMGNNSFGLYLQSSIEDSQKLPAEKKLERLTGPEIEKLLEELSREDNIAEARMWDTTIIPEVQKIRKKLPNKAVEFPTQLGLSTISEITSSLVLAGGLKDSSPRETKNLYRVLVWNKTSCPPVYTHFNDYDKYHKEPGFISFSEGKFSFSEFSIDESNQHIFIAMTEEKGRQIKGKNISSLCRYLNEKEFIVPPQTPLTLKKISTVENFHFYQAWPAEERYRHATDEIVEIFFEFCMKNLFNRPFADMLGTSDNVRVPSSEYKFQLRDKEITVYKRKHGAVHVVRKMERLPVILEFYTTHATEEDFRLFCDNLRRKETVTILLDNGGIETVTCQQLINELSLVMGSTSLGRESDSHDPEDVAQYRRRSAVIFKNISDHISGRVTDYKISPGRLAVYSDVLTNLCNAEYMAGLQNFHAYVMRIVYTTLVLDLNRCYKKADILKELQQFLRTVADDKSLKSGEALLDYSTCQTEITGDVIESDDHIVPSRDYQPVFAYHSNLASSCRSALRSIPSICFEGANVPPMDEKGASAFTYQMSRQLFEGRFKKSLTGDFANFMREMIRLNLGEKTINAFLKVLIEGTDNLNKYIDEMDDNPLLVAAKAKVCDKEVVDSLISAKIDPNVRDTVTGATPLMYAMQSNSVSKVMLLLEKKADLNLVDKQQKRALDYAPEGSDVLKALMQ